LAIQFPTNGIIGNPMQPAPPLNHPIAHGVAGPTMIYKTVNAASAGKQKPLGTVGVQAGGVTA
jgi:hypothetical protein